MDFFKIKFNLERLSGNLKKMTNKFFRKQVARHKETGFPIVDKEECSLNNSLVVAIAAGATLTTIIAAWRQQRGKRKKEED